MVSWAPASGSLPAPQFCWCAREPDWRSRSKIVEALQSGSPMSGMLGAGKHVHNLFGIVAGGASEREG